MFSGVCYHLLPQPHFSWLATYCGVQNHWLNGLKIQREKKPIFEAGAMPCMCRCGTLVNGGQWNPNSVSSLSMCISAKSARSSFSIS